MDISKQEKENNKRIAKNTFVLYIRMFLVMGVTLYTSRVVLNSLGITDFGIYNVVGGIIAMMGILNSTMSVASQRFFTFELGKKDYEKLGITFSISFLIYMLFAIIFFILAESVGLWFLNTQLTIPPERLDAANWVYQFSIFSTIVTLLSNPFIASVIAHENMKVFAYIGLFEVILKLLIACLLLIFTLDHLIMYGFLLFLSSLIVTSIYIRICIKKYEECRYRFYWDSRLFKKILIYSGWNLFGSASSLVKAQGLNILLNLFFNPSVNAARGIAYQVDNAIVQFFTNFFTAVRPQITKYYANNEVSSMLQLVFRSSKFSFYLILVISLPILIETPYIIQLWLGQIPEYVVIFTRLVILISALDAMASPIMTTAHATGNIKLYQSLVGTINILVIPISYVFLTYLNSNPSIVFYISLVLTLISFFVRLWVVKRLINQFPIILYIKEVFCLSFIVAIFSLLFPMGFKLFFMNNNENSFICFVCICLVCCISTILTIYLIGLDKDER